MKKNILTGIRPTGNLHLGHYFGATRNWVLLQDEYNSYIENDISLGFKYLSPILNSLGEYENNRDIYKTFDEFYPNIIENIKNYKLENTINKNT